MICEEEVEEGRTKHQNVVHKIYMVNMLKNHIESIEHQEDHGVHNVPEKRVKKMKASSMKVRNVLNE